MFSSTVPFQKLQIYRIVFLEFFKAAVFFRDLHTFTKDLLEYLLVANRKT